MKHRDEILKLRSTGLTYDEIAAALDCAKSTISYHCSEKKTGRSRNKRKKGLKRKTRIGVVIVIRSKPISCICEECQSIFYKKASAPKRFCSHECYIKHSNFVRNSEFIEAWQQGRVSGGRSNKSGDCSLSSITRRYIFKKFESKCSQCGWAEMNPFTKTLPLEIDHIDGDPTNHSESNLDLVCPNCHSLRNTHSSKKSPGRRYYRQKYRKEVGCDGVKPPESEDNQITAGPAIPTV